MRRALRPIGHADLRLGYAKGTTTTAVPGSCRIAGSRLATPSLTSGHLQLVGVPMKHYGNLRRDSVADAASALVDWQKRELNHDSIGSTPSPNGGKLWRLPPLSFQADARARAISPARAVVSQQAQSVQLYGSSCSI